MPDAGLHRRRPDAIGSATAALVVEIQSPDDETWGKLGFYAEFGVDDVLIVSGATRQVTWLALRDGRYVETPYSGLLGAQSRDLGAHIDWPDVVDDEDR